MENRQVTIRVVGSSAVISGHYESELEEFLSIPDPNRWFSKAFKEERWDGMRKFYRGATFPSGLTDYVIEKYAAMQVDTRVIERDFEPVDLSRFDNTYLPGITLRVDQVDSVRALMEVPRGILKSGTGCHRAGQGIMLWNGNVKRVEDVRVGDVLRGPDGTGRNVLRLCRGADAMFEVRPVKGASFVVNADHVLSLVKTCKDARRPGGSVVDVTVREWMGWTKGKKHLHKLFRVGVHEWPYPRTLPVCPWLLGMLLGDGTLTSGRVWVTTKDREVVASLRRCAKDLRMHVSTYSYGDGRCPTYGLINKRGSSNPLLESLRSCGVYGRVAETKSIPRFYLTASREDRLDLLAGLIDSDGSLGKGCYDYVSKSPKLSADVVFLARGLGLAAYMAPCKKKDQNGVEGDYYRVSISGGVAIVPCRVGRKRAAPRQQKKSVLRTGFSVVPTGTFEPYFGFTLDGDGRYLLDDFTVTHNSGKTEIATCVARLYWEERGWQTLIIVPKKGLLHQTAERLQKYYGSDISVGIIGDSVREPGVVTVATAQTLQQFESYKKDKTVNGRKVPQVYPADPIVRDIAQTREVLILDECHHSSSESWFDFCQFSKAKVRLGMSGSPLKNSELSDFRVQAATGPVIRDVPSEVLVSDGSCAKPKIVVVRSENATGPHLPHELVQYTTVSGKVRSKKVKMPYALAYRVGCVENHHHNTAVIRATAWMVDHGKRTLLLCRKKAHWSALHEMLDEQGIDHLSVWGATSIHDRDRAKRLLEQGKLKCILASTIFDEGEDVPGIDAMVLAEGVEVSTNAIQRVGRGMRKKGGDNDVWIVDFYMANHPDMLKHSDARVAAWEEAHLEVLPLFEWPDPNEVEYDKTELLPFVDWDAKFAEFHRED